MAVRKRAALPDVAIDAGRLEPAEKVVTLTKDYRSATTTVQELAKQLVEAQATLAVLADTYNAALEAQRQARLAVIAEIEGENAGT